MTDREERYRALFDANFEPLQAFARRRTAGADADDLVAEVFTVAWRRLDDIPRHNELPWLYGVAHRTLANQRRSARRRLQLVQRMVEREPRGPTERPDDPPVLRALAQLRPDDQAVLRLAAWEELTAAQIATVLECTPNAAALRLSRARARLRDVMTELGAGRTQARGRPTDD